MVVVQCVGWDTAHFAYCADKTLRHEIEDWLGNPLHVYITELFRKICRNMRVSEHRLDDAMVMIIRHENPKYGIAIKEPFQHGRYKPPNRWADIKVGYAGQSVEFEKTLIHEALHLLNYDEDATERKTQRLYRQIHK